MTRTLVAAALAALFATNPSVAQTYPGTSWATRTPAQAGMNVTKLNELRAATGWTSGSVMRGLVVKDGYIVYSWGSITQRGDWASAAKPLISSMMFYAVKEGRTSGVNARIYQYGWPTTVADQAITWHHLGSMTSGYALADNPGARWAYNDYAIALYCRTLFTQTGDSVSVFGQSMSQVVANRLAPLQFQDDGVIGSGRNGCQLYASARDFARIGWWWLNRFKWKTQQLLPDSYFTNFVKNQVSSSLPRTAGGPINDYLGVGTTGGDTNQNILGQGSYGYNWTFNQPTRRWPSAPADTFQARGHHNAEMMFMIPSRRLLLVCAKCRPSTDAALYYDANRYLSLLLQANGG
jgi:hypothetical protein